MNYQKLLIVLFLFGIFSFSAHAQQIKNKATIVLKNGTVLQGQMIMSMFDDYVSIKLSETEHMDVYYEKIDKIIFGVYEPEAEKEMIKETAPWYFTKRGFMHWAEIGLVTGNSAIYESAAYSLSMVNGFRFNPYFGLGLGVGIDGYDRLNVLPVFASARGTLKMSKLSPFYFVNLGYGAAWGRQQDFGFEYDKVKGGLMFQPGGGYQINFKNSSLFFSLSYKLQHYDMTYHYFNDWAGSSTEIREKRTMHRASFGVGLTF